MPITFTCANCQSRMTVPDAMSGKRGKCSKCKGPVIVPGSNGTTVAEAASPPTTVPAPARPAAKPARAPAATSAPVVPLPPTTEEPPPTVDAPPIDFEAEAAAALADAPKEEETLADFLEFNCPQCDEKLKLPVALAGKRHQCPECKRIIQVPMPQKKDPTNWRDTGPKRPAGARRDDEPAPEGAWGSTVATRASIDALKEAGVVKAKQKPLTFYQKFQPYLLIGGPILLLLSVGLGVWRYLGATQERRSLQAALTAAESANASKIFGNEGLMAVHAYAGSYFLNSDKPGCATQARDQYSKVVSLAKSSRGPGGDALLSDVALMILDLAGGPEEIDGDRKIEWKETHRFVRSAMEGIDGAPPRLDALRKVAAGLIERGQLARVMPLTAALYTSAGPEKSEALAAVGLILYRLGKTAEAEAAYNEALTPYSVKQGKPLLRPAIVALALVLGKKPPEPNAKNLEDEENFLIGKAEGLARQGKLEEARKVAQSLNEAGGARLRGMIALAIGAAEDKHGTDDILTAVEAASTARGRPEFNWPLLRLVQAGLEAGVPGDKLEPAAKAIPDRNLASWGQLRIVRARLADSRSIEGTNLVEPIPANTVGGLVARMDLARHNARRDSGWASNVKNWDEGARELGSLGIALGMQGSKK